MSPASDKKFNMLYNSLPVELKLKIWKKVSTDKNLEKRIQRLPKNLQNKIAGNFLRIVGTPKSSSAANVWKSIQNENKMMLALNSRLGLGPRRQ